MVSARLDRVLAVGWEEAGVEPAKLWPGDRRQIARRARERAGVAPGCHPEQLAKALGLRVICMAIRGCGGEITDGRIIVYRWHHSESERRARIAHGLAHALLLAEGADHSETDALLLTHDFR